MSRGRSCASASSSSTSTAVDAVFVFALRFSAGSCSLSKRISDSFFGELMLNSSPASSKICALRVASSCSTWLDCSGSARPSTRTPARSMATSTGNQRQLQIEVERLEIFTAQKVAQRSRQLQREVGALARVVERLFGGNLRERNRPSRRGRTRPLRAAPCSRCARARDPRAGATNASRRAGSSRASCRSRGPAARCRGVRGRSRRTSGRGRPSRSPGSSRTSFSAASASGTLTPSRVGRRDPTEKIAAAGAAPQAARTAPDGARSRTRARRCPLASPTGHPAGREVRSDSTDRSCAASARTSSSVRRWRSPCRSSARRRVLHDERAEPEPREQLEASLARSRRGTAASRDRTPPARRCGSAPARGSAAHRPRGASRPSR